MSTIKATNFQHASAANPALVLAADGSATANVSAINGGPLAGFRNAIINGNFDIWQRGTSFAVTASETYSADRWIISLDGTGATRTISRQAFALGQTDVPGEPTYFLRFNQSVAGTGATGNDMTQRVEGVRTFAGQQVTISFWAKAAAGLTVPLVSIGQFFGSGGSPSATVFTSAATNVSVTTAWQKFSYTITLPSITGKTLGTSGNDSLLVLIRAPINTTFTLDLAQVQLEPGPIATPFERRPVGTELALCQRYFYNRQSAQYLTTGTNVSGFRQHIVHPVGMRAAPSITSSNVTFLNANSIDISGISTGGFAYGAVASASSVAVSVTSDLAVSAEL